MYLRHGLSEGLLNIVVNNHIDDDIKGHAQYNDRTRETPNSQICSIKKQLLVTATLPQESDVKQQNPAPFLSKVPHALLVIRLLTRNSLVWGCFLCT